MRVALTQLQGRKKVPSLFWGKGIPLGCPPADLAFTGEERHCQSQIDTVVDEEVTAP